MENLFRYLTGGVAGLLSLLAPVRGLIVCAVVFIAIDFLTGVAASRKRARKAGRAWGFESEKAWATVVKLAFVMGGIVLAWLIDVYILDFMKLNLAKLFTGFVCGVELWSYLENAAEISDHPVFRSLRQLMKNRMENGVNNYELRR
jgi:phage-related holin